MSKTIYIHPDAHAKMLKAGDLIVLDTQTGETKLRGDGTEYTITKFVPSMVRKQIRKPRSKKVRIQKKWRNDLRNWDDVSVAYLVDESRPFLRPQRVDLSRFERQRLDPVQPLYPPYLGGAWNAFLSNRY